MRAVGAAEQVAAVAERVGGQTPDVLAVVGEQREVVRDDVGGGDRHERVREREAELAARHRLPQPALPHARDRAPVDRRHQHHRDDRARAANVSSSARPMPKPSEREEVLQVGRDRVEQRALAAAVERRDPDRHDQQRDEPAHRREPDRARHRRARVEHAVAAGDRREAGEQAEVDAERVGVARPRLDAVEAHPHERDHEVEQREDRERLRLAPGGPAQLDDAEEAGSRPPPAGVRGARG